MFHFSVFILEPWSWYPCFVIHLKNPTSIMIQNNSATKAVSVWGILPRLTKQGVDLFLYISSFHSHFEVKAVKS